MPIFFKLHNLYNSSLKPSRLIFAESGVSGGTDRVRDPGIGVLGVDTIDLPSGNESTYEESLSVLSKKVRDELIKAITQVLDKNIFFDRGTNNKLFLVDNNPNRPTQLLLDLFKKVAKSEITFVRSKIHGAISMTNHAKDEAYVSSIVRGAIRHLQALISEAEKKEISSKAGYDALMDNFINGNSAFGKILYGKVLVEEFDRMHDTGKLSSLLFIDLDDFGLVNKEFGQDVGDEALRHMSGVISRILRSRGGDKKIRFGGEEIGIIMPGTSGKKTVIPADRIRDSLQKNPLLARRHIKRFSNRDEVPIGSVSNVSADRFEELIKKNGITKIEIGEGVDIPKNIMELIKGKDTVTTIKGKRGIKIVLPDARCPNSSIVLYYVPLTASIGISEFSSDMMHSSLQKINSIMEAENGVEAVAKLTEWRAGSGNMTRDESMMIDSLKAGGDMSEEVKNAIIGLLKKEAFSELRTKADEQMVLAKKSGKNIVAMDGLVYNQDTTAADLM